MSLTISDCVGSRCDVNTSWILPDKWLDSPSVAWLIRICWLNALMLMTPQCTLDSLFKFGFGFLAADLVSGLIHYAYVDNILVKGEKIRWEEQSGIWTLYLPCRDGYASHHHMFPRGWVDISDEHILLTSQLWSIPVFLLKLCIDSSIVNGLIVGSTFSALIHKYAHQRNHGMNIPWPVRILQDAGILLGPQKHSGHHRRNGWLDWCFISGHSDVAVNSLAKLLHQTGLAPKYDQTSIDMMKAPDKFRVVFIFPGEQQIKAKGLFSYDGVRIVRDAASQ